MGVNRGGVEEEREEEEEEGPSGEKGVGLRSPRRRR